jgi:hypothetical protein
LIITILTLPYPLPLLPPTPAHCHMPRVFSKYFWNQIIIIQSWSEKNISRNYIFERSFKAGNISFGLLLFLVRLKQYSEDTFYLPNRSNCTIFHLRMAVHLVDIKCWGMGQIHHSNFREICNNSSKKTEF